MSRPPLPYGRQWVDDDDVAAVAACLRGDWLTQGPLVDRFEAALCEATGAAHAVAVSSGTAALHLAALAAGVGPADTGVTSAVTFVASANCVEYCGGRAEFADVDPATGLIDVGSLAERVAELTAAGRPPKVIVPVDLAGQPADLPAVRAVADRCGAKVVADAAHSLGAAYSDGGRVFRAGGCAHADMAVLSFHPVKPVTTGEGGAVLTNNSAVAARVRELRSHGVHKDPARLLRPAEGPWYYEQAALGYHYRLTDIQAALGVSQLGKLGRFVARRGELARRYDAALAAAPLAGWVTPLRTRPETAAHAYHLYVVRLVRRPGEPLTALAARRKALYLGLRDYSIQAQVHYVPVPMQPYYRGRSDARYPGAEEYYAGCLSVPLFPRMAVADVDRVTAALAACAAADR